MRRLILLVLASLLVGGCLQKSPTQTDTCQKPYLKVGNDCCLDRDSNGICDKDEIAKPACPEQKVCDTPYINVGNECCLDANYNRICDKDEQKSQPNCPACPVQNKTFEINISDCKGIAGQTISNGSMTTTDRLNQCDKIRDAQDRDNCLTALALETNMPSACSMVGGADFLCYEQLAIKYKNKGYCDLIYSGSSFGDPVAMCKDKVKDAMS